MDSETIIKNVGSINLTVANIIANGYFGHMV